MKENDPTSVLLFLVGTKKDLIVSVSFLYCNVEQIFKKMLQHIVYPTVVCSCSPRHSILLMNRTPLKWPKK